MGSVASWVRSFGVSIAIHAIVLAGISDRTVRGMTDPRPHALLPVRIVWSEPAPAAPGAPAAPAPIPAAPAAAAIAPEAPVRRDAAIEPRSAPARAPAARRAAPPRSAVPPPAAENGGGAAATAPAAAPAAPAGGTGGGLGGTGTGNAPLALAAVARPPEIVERVLPEYPARARALELEGQVVLEVVLDREGRPEPGMRVLRSQPPFDAAALAAVRRWRFRPARDAEGHAVRVLMEITVRFELR